jgi:radical SAM superfamily enzyme YgiQ (UPF0313 family)
MDSMINRYTADRKIRSDDAYTPGGVGGKRPDRAAIVYSQRCREAFKDVPIVLGGIEGSLRRIAHYDYWSDKVRRSIVVDAKCRPAAVRQCRARHGRDGPPPGGARAGGEPSPMCAAPPLCAADPEPQGWFEIDSTRWTSRARREPRQPLPDHQRAGGRAGQTCAREDDDFGKVRKRGGASDAERPRPPATLTFVPTSRGKGKLKVPPRERTVIRLPSYEQVKSDPVLYAHANRVLHLETNPGNARALVQRHGEGATARDVWINPPPIPLTTAEMDHVFDLPYARSPHPAYADENGSHDGATKIPAWEMIRFSVNIMRGCFGGCTFCSHHRARRPHHPEPQRRLGDPRDRRHPRQGQGLHRRHQRPGRPHGQHVPHRLQEPEIEAACRKPSCVYPGICSNLNTDHGPLIKHVPPRAALKGIKKILIGSGLRYDLAVQSPEYVKELVSTTWAAT